MIRIAVVEDVPEERAEIEEKLRTVGDSRHTFAIRCYPSGEALLDALETQMFDLIFLDVRLKGMSGLETAAQVRKNDQNVLIVFLTGWADYAIEGYKCRAFRYLLKPVQPALLTECLQEAAAWLACIQQQFITLGQQNRQRSFQPDEIRFISASGNYLIVHTLSGCERVRGRLKHVVDVLPAQFVQVHRCEIVNVRHIRILDGSRLVLTDGTCLTISRPHRETTRHCFDLFH